MKKILLLSVLLLLCLFAKSQDTIIKYNGEQILSKIIEITTTEVKYKKFDFQDGPTYVEEKSTIHFIKYSNGTTEELKAQQPVIAVKETPKPEEIKTDYYGGPAKPSNKIEMWGNYYQYKGFHINERELHRMLLQTKDKRLITLVGNAKDAHGLQFIGFAAIPLGIAAAFFLDKSMLTNNSYSSAYNPNSSDIAISGICALAAIACPIASGVYKHNRSSYNRQAVKIYNETY